MRLAIVTDEMMQQNRVERDRLAEGQPEGRSEATANLSWRVKQTQLAAQLLQGRRPLGPRQKSEAFVVAMIPRRTFGSDNPRRSEGMPLVPQK